MNDFEIARDELALDAIAAGRAPDHTDEALSLLYALRTDLEEPAPVVPLRRRRAWLYVAVAAAAGLVFGGVAVSDRPGQPLYNVRRVVLGDADDVRAAKVTTLLDRAAGRLAVRDRAGARRLLAEAARELPSIPAGDRAVLRARYVALVALAAEPSPVPSPSPTRNDDSTPEPEHTSEPPEQEHESESPSPSDDHGGEGSGETSESDH